MAEQQLLVGRLLLQVGALVDHRGVRVDARIVRRESAPEAGAGAADAQEGGRGSDHK